MSWAHDFGVVASADELRRQKVRYRMESPRADDDSRAEARAQAKAALEQIEAVRAAAVAILESPAFADFPVKVMASGMATVDHQPVPAVIEARDVELSGGEVVNVEGTVKATALESITLTLTQAPPDEAVAPPPPGSSG